MAKVGQSLIDFDPAYVLLTGEVSSLLHSRLSAARVAPFRNHNELTCAFVMSLFILTGSRAIQKYLSRLIHQVHYDLNLAFPLDKDVSEVHRFRIAALPSCVAPMLIEYSLHLRRLALSLMEMGELELAGKFQALLDPATSHLVQPIDYFSIIDRNMNHRGIERSDIKSVLGPRWPIRLDEARGQYFRYMKSIGAPVFLVRQQGGHQSKAFPFYGVNNQYTIYEFRRDFLDFADKFADAVRIWPCS